MPRNRAIRSEIWPKTSGSTLGRRSPPGTRGWSSLLRLMADLLPVRPTAPLLAEQVVHDVVDRDDAEQPAHLVDHRAARPGCTWRTRRRPVRSEASGGEGSMSVSSTPETSDDGGSRSSLWKWATPRYRPVGVSIGGRHTYTMAASDGVRSGLRIVGQRLGDGGVRGEHDRLVGHHAAGRVVLVREQLADAVPPPPAPSASAAPRPARPAGRRAGRRRRRDPSLRARPRPARRRGCRASPTSVASQLLHHVGEPLVVERERDLARGASGQSSRSTPARSAGRILSKAASRLAAPWTCLGHCEARSRSSNP